MSVKESEMIESLREQDANFANLFERHAELDTEIRGMESKPHLSTEEEMEIKRLKKLKLHTKDEMAQILKQHQDAEEA